MCVGYQLEGHIGSYYHMLLTGRSFMNKESDYTSGRLRSWFNQSQGLGLLKTNSKDNAEINLNNSCEKMTCAELEKC